MKNTSLETKLGMFVALVVVAAVVLLEMAGGTDFFKKGYHLHGLFTSAQELKIGDPVKMAGVPIGKVEKIGFDQGKVKVTMKINRGEEVKTDAKATIRFAGLMGQNFVSINLGTPTAQNFVPDSVIDTVEQADLAAIMQKLENAAGGIEKLGQSFSGQSIENIMGPMMDAFKEATPLIKDARLTLQDASLTLKEFRTNTIPKFTATLGGLQTVSERMARGEGSIGKLLTDEALYHETVGTMKSLNKTATDVQSLMTEAKGSLGDVRLALSDARKTLNTATDTMTTAKQTLTDVRADLQAGKGSLGKLLKDEALYTETTSAMRNLREIMEKINKGQGSVGKFVNDDSLFKNAKMTLQKLDKATEGLEDQGPLSVLGIAVNSLF
jgi:phospholipid/cholesterol/gamma-HCH transport system substrate-binding protein